MEKCKHGFIGCAACATGGASKDARRDRVQRRAQVHSPTTVVERECFEAVYAYEEALSKINGKTTRAGRTWPLIAKKGVIAAVEGIVVRSAETNAYRILVEMGLQEMTFEAVVMRHKAAFSAAAAAASEQRLGETHSGTGIKRLPPL